MNTWNMINYYTKYSRMHRWRVFMSILNKNGGIIMKIIDAAIFLAILILVVVILKRSIYII